MVGRLNTSPIFRGRPASSRVIPPKDLPAYLLNTIANHGRQSTARYDRNERTTFPNSNRNLSTQYGSQASNSQVRRRLIPPPVSHRSSLSDRRLISPNFSVLSSNDFKHQKKEKQESQRKTNTSISMARTASLRAEISTPLQPVETTDYNDDWESDYYGDCEFDIVKSQ